MAIDQMLSKPLNDIAYSDLEILVNENIRESRTLEFKRDRVGSRDEDKREFLADVSAFANSAGGDLIFGIEEREGIAVAIPALKVPDLDAEIQRLEGILRSGLEPRLPSIELRWIPTPTGRGVLVVRTPRSWAAPHRVTFREHSRFYGRTSAGKYALDVAELRTAFIAAESVIQNIRRFRNDRVATIEADEGPVPLRTGAKLVFHVIPVSAFAAPQDTLIDDHRDLIWPLGAASGFNTRHTLEGIASYIGREDVIESMYSYALLFRSGIIEAGSVVGHVNQDGPFVAPETVEWSLIKTFDSYCEALKRHDLEPPYYVFLSLIGVRDHRLWFERPVIAPTLRRDVLLLPELMIADPTLPSEQTLRAII